jgi:hypothetical protein
MSFEDRVISIEQRYGLTSTNNDAATDGEDWSGEFCDTFITISKQGKVRLTWTRPRKVQPEAPAGARCTGELSDEVRFFELDEREPHDQKTPARILFRRAHQRIDAMFVAAEGCDNEIGHFAADVDEQDRAELEELGITDSDIAAAFAEEEL